MKKKKELKDEFELDIEFEVDKNNRVDMNQVIELISAYNKLFRTYKQLKDNWNELKKWLEENESFDDYCNETTFTSVLDKMQELELIRCDLHNRTSERDSYESELNECLSQQKEFIEYLEDKIYSIEPKGTGINYNCEYDSEEDYVMAMQEQSRLNTLKEILQKYKEIIGVSNEKK